MYVYVSLGWILTCARFWYGTGTVIHESGRCIWEVMYHMGLPECDSLVARRDSGNHLLNADDIALSVVAPNFALSHLMTPTRTSYMTSLFGHCSPGS